jgi:predicted DNA-binding antitoxin AbrB/MazE fold protein
MPTVITKGAKGLAREIRARFTKGKIEPLEEVDLKEGDEVRVIIPDHAKVKRAIEALRATAGAWKGTHDPEELKRNIYADRPLAPDLNPSYELPHRYGLGN